MQLYRHKINKTKNNKNFLKYNYFNINNINIENFNYGDYITIFYLREETLEKIRFNGLVVNKNNTSNNFKLFINNEIILNFNLESPFIIRIINLTKPTKYKFKIK